MNVLLFKVLAESLVVQPVHGAIEHCEEHNALAHKVGDYLSVISPGAVPDKLPPWQGQLTRYRALPRMRRAYVASHS